VVLRDVDIRWATTAGSNVDSHDYLHVGAAVVPASAWLGGEMLVAHARCGLGADAIFGSAPLRDGSGPAMHETIADRDADARYLARIFADRHVVARGPCEIGFDIVPEAADRPVVHLAAAYCLSAGSLVPGRCDPRVSDPDVPPQRWTLAWRHQPDDFGVSATAHPEATGRLIVVWNADCPDRLHRRSQFGTFADDLLKSRVPTLHADAQFDPPLEGRCEVFAQVWTQATPDDPPRAPYIAYRGCYERGERHPFPCDPGLAADYEGPGDAPVSIREIALRVDTHASGATLHIEASVTLRRRLPDAPGLAFTTSCDVPGEPHRWGSIQMIPEIRALHPGEGEWVRAYLYDMDRTPKRCTVDLTLDESHTGGERWHLARACLEGSALTPCSIHARVRDGRPRP
jgi:hypothetical protein